MSKKFLVPIDLVQNELQNAAVQNLASAPSAPVAGQLYYDTTTGRFMWRGAAAWFDALARASHTGTQLAATISDFDTQVRTSTINQLATPTADFSMGTHKITNLTAGASANDAVNYAQLQAVQQGRDFKDSVKAATAVNGTLATAFANGQVIDGVTLTTGDRILVKNQTTGSENGIYTVAASGAPVRAIDADDGTKLTAGASTMVEQGTANADTQWTLTTDGAIVVGTTSLTFAKTGSTTTYTNGTGITLSGGVIAIDTAVVASKFSANVGDGTSTAIAVTHNLGTRAVSVQVFRNSTPWDEVECDITRNTTNQVTLTFAAPAPTTNQYTVIVTG